MNTDMEIVISRMREMRMSHLAGKVDEMAADPNFELRKPSDVISELFNYEYTSRQTRRIKNLLKEAQLKYPSASLDDSLKDPDRRINIELINALAECRWIEEKKNLLVTGKTGTGKTYLTNALAICAMQKGIHVRYVKASMLINDLNDRQFTDGYEEALKEYTSVGLLIIDDLGLMSLDIQRCLQLFEVLDAREGSRSVIVTSQLPVKSWYDIFQNNVYADACMSRLTCNAYRLELQGRDMRKDQSAS